jgi:hypothetical protein
MTRNAIMIGTKVGAAEASTGAMLIDSFVANTTDGCPLITFKQTAAAYSYCTFSNLPGVATVGGSSTSSWVIAAMGWTRGLVSAVSYNLADRFDLWQDSKIHVGRLVVAHVDGAAAGTANLYGYLRGLVKIDFLAVSNAGGTVNLGDTISIDGNTWTVIAYGYFGNTGAQNVVLVTRAT